MDSRRGSSGQRLTVGLARGAAGRPAASAMRPGRPRRRPRARGARLRRYSAAAASGCAPRSSSRPRALRSRGPSRPQEAQALGRQAGPGQVGGGQRAPVPDLLLPGDPHPAGDREEPRGDQSAGGQRRGRPAALRGGRRDGLTREQHPADARIPQLPDRPVEHEVVQVHGGGHQQPEASLEGDAAQRRRARRPARAAPRSPLPPAGPGRPRTRPPPPPPDERAKWREIQRYCTLWATAIQRNATGAPSDSSRPGSGPGGRPPRGRRTRAPGSAPARPPAAAPRRLRSPEGPAPAPPGRPGRRAASSREQQPRRPPRGCPAARSGRPLRRRTSGSLPPTPSTRWKLSKVIATESAKVARSIRRAGALGQRVRRPAPGTSATRP